MGLGLLVIGDEILSGKRLDRHFSQVITLLAERGMALDWAHFAGDDELAIADVIAQAHRRGDVLLSCGGIGATPDDHTRQAAARAYGRPLVRHPEGERLIVGQYGEKAYPHRVLMADFPEGAQLIPNPVNQVAGFSVENSYFVPGFPEMAWPMLAWVLDHRLRDRHRDEPPVEYSLRAVGETGEGDLLPLMQETLAAHPGIKLSSLPFRGDGRRPRHIEFGFKGPRAAAAAAYATFAARLADWPELRIEPVRPPQA